MSRDKTKVLNLAPRRPGQTRPSEAQIRQLEETLEARGNGVAGQPVERLDVQTSRSPNVQPEAAGGRGVVERVGRLRADGSRTGARTLRRMTMYFPPDLARELELYAVQNGVNVSDANAEAVREYLRKRKG